ncbi:hypothetical protein [Butyrivibrio sp. MC2021]|uniref:hypothetical protein n=1 Tax=Butyrivibrio sp. MC2021 TaxID=1408306 RepID=UPI0004791484|nr:hypothetical protein [Butyrivibrio sp. MC2021]
MSTNFFSSLSGSFDYVSSMSGLLSDYSSIKSGAYGSLMKSYVNKVGNKAALNAYRETGSTTTAADSVSGYSTSKSGSSSKTSFLDSHLSSISSSSKTTESKETTTTDTASATTTDKYAKYKSSWLDDQLKQYDKDANKTTAADTSVAMDTTI